MARGAYDAVVVGAGIGGLTAACYLARAGRKVALLERSDAPGGLCRTVAVAGFRWNPAVYSVRGLARGSPMREVLEELGVLGGLEFTRSEVAYRIVCPDGSTLDISTDREAILGQSSLLQPGGDRGLAELLRRVEGFSLARDYGELRSLSLAEVFRRYLGEGTLSAALAAPLTLSLGLGPERISALFAFMKYRMILAEGVCWPVGGAGRISSALADRFIELGGEPFFGEEAVRLEVRDGAVAAVVGNSGRRYEAKTLVYNGHPLELLKSAGEDEGRTPFHRRARSSATGLSAVVVLAGLVSDATENGADAPHHTVLMGDEEPGGLCQRLGAGEFFLPYRGPLGVVRQSAMDPGCAPAGAEAVSLFALAPRAERWRPDPAPDQLAASLLERARTLPWARGAVREIRVLTPPDFGRLSSGASGSIGGWEATPEQTGIGRLSPKTPLKNVFLAGHWTRPGMSVLNVAVSGKAAAGGALGVLGG